MRTIFVFVSAIIVYFVLAYMLTRILKKLIVWNFRESLPAALIRH